MGIKVIDLGLCPYQIAHKLQLEFVEKVRHNPNEEYLIVCSHNPVVTLGKKTQDIDLCGWQGETHAIERGGRATYHGPGQLVAYPIVHLDKRNKDLYRFVRALENSMVLTLKDFALEAKGDPDNTGVWVGDKKIASIGIAVRRWVTYHGLALNLEYDPQAFQGINPCGFSTSTMTNLKELIQWPMDRDEIQRKLTDYLTSELNSLVTPSFLSAQF